MRNTCALIGPGERRLCGGFELCENSIRDAHATAPTARPLWGGMYQGGELVSQSGCGGFDSHPLHQGPRTSRAGSSRRPSDLARRDRSPPGTSDARRGLRTLRGLADACGVLSPCSSGHDAGLSPRRGRVQFPPAIPIDSRRAGVVGLWNRMRTAAGHAKNGPAPGSLDATIDAWRPGTLRSFECPAGPGR